MSKKKKIPLFMDEMMVDEPDYQLASRAPQLETRTDNRLEIFTGRKVNVDFDSSVLLEIKPQALQNELRFRMISDQDLLLDPKDIWVKIKCRILQIDENNVAAPIPPPMKMRRIVETVVNREVEEPPENAGGNKRILLKKETVDKEVEILDGIGAVPGPGFCLTQFRNVRVLLGVNQVSLEDSAKDLFHFQVFMKTIFKIPKPVLENQLKEGLFILDTNEEISPFEGNKGMTERYITSFTRQNFTMISPLLVDGLHNLHENRFFPPGFPLTLEFDKNPIQVCMTSNKPEVKLQVEIIEMALLARYYKMTTKTSSHFHQSIAKKVGFYSYTGHFMEYLNIPKNTIVFRHIFDETKLLPEKMTLALLPARTMRGTLDSNCFYFEPNGLQSLSILEPNGRKMTVNLDEGTERSYREFYRFLVQECNLDFLSETLSNIPLENYINGRFFIVIDFTRNHNAISEIDSVPRYAKLEMELKFKAPLEQDFSLIMMNEQTRSYVISGAHKVALV